jgi:hypothetical protein
MWDILPVGPELASLYFAMSLFEFLMVLVSIIIGLGIAEILRGIARLLRNRDSIEHYWLHSVLVVFVFVALLQQWWEIWGVQGMQQWTFFGLLMMLGGPIGLFLIAYLLFPQPIRGASVRNYYYGAMRPIWWLGVFTVTTATLFRPVVLGDALITVDNATSFLGFIGFIVLGLSTNKMLHSVLVPIFLGSIVWDVVALSFEIS